LPDLPELGRSEMTVFPREAASVAAARALVARSIGHCQPEIIDVACLLTSELATNALVHAHSTFDVVVSEIGGLVHVEVTDASNAHVQAILATPLQMHGRGLYLVRELSTKWGVILLPPGKTVWFDLECSREPSTNLTRDHGHPDDGLPQRLRPHPEAAAMWSVTNPR
jgi:sigma-B regulation protein RsbU (phosphoserine phosphatase)